jgi:phosphoribosylformylglycinamidine synthase subunit PurL
VTYTSPAEKQGVHRELGLTDDELDQIRARLGRDPTFTELAMFSVMWSEHCSYKSSRTYLKTLPTEGEHVLVGPGEGAGVIEIAPGLAVAWKIESHNHPSFVEPVNGAATGVGGIVRDILSMGARPIALLDSLRFGKPGGAHTGYLVDGVVAGISSYGNSIGVPTVGGEAVFDECYATNPLVNVACLGVIEDRLVHARAEADGNAVVLIGSSTGRDGIGGASVLASAEFGDSSHDKRPSVQVGDPLTEKLLIEACLELVRRGLVAALQDLGAGGISCPTSEMSSKGASGMRLHIDRVPRREPEMEPFEVMISESQERMLAIVEADRIDEVLDVCRRWELDAAVIGEVTGTGRIEVVDEDARTVADVPAGALAEEAPILKRRRARPAWIDSLWEAPPGDEPPADLELAFLDLLRSPNICSKRWIWEQYDHMIGLGAVLGPGGDAAVIRLPHRREAVAITTDGPGRACYLDPYNGARQAVAEAARNIACTGARPMALTNCLNFGSPQRPEVMWQFAEVVRGIGDASRALGTPVTGGNVSFYNETNGHAIHPTPVIGMLGVLEEAARALGIGLPRDGEVIVLLGTTDSGDFGGSEYAWVVNGVVAGRLPALDLDREQSLHTLLRTLAAGGLITSAHDLSGGGLGVALAEAALAGGRGFSVDLAGVRPHLALFSESPSRALVTCSPGALDGVLEAAATVPLVARPLGIAGGDELDFGVFAVALEDARHAFETGLVGGLSATIE